MRRPAGCLRARMWCRDHGLLYPRIRWPVTPHALRHTFSVMAIPKGISLLALQRLLGHDRLTTTEIYLNLSSEEAVREFREKWKDNDSTHKHCQEPSHRLTAWT
jgi:integrase